MSTRRVAMEESNPRFILLFFFSPTAQDFSVIYLRRERIRESADNTPNSNSASRNQSSKLLNFKLNPISWIKQTFL